MLNTASAILQGTEDFKTAYDLIPDEGIPKVRYLYAKAEDNTPEPVGYYQLYSEDKDKWSSPTKCTYDKNGQLVPLNLDVKSKLKNTEIFYGTFTKPTHAGRNAEQAWLIGDIDACRILDDDYNIQGMLISTIKDALPKFYISFKRLVCENQFSSLGRNNAAMYVDMNKYLKQDYSLEAKEKLASVIQEEVERRIKDAERIYNNLATTHLTDEQVKHMFEMLTINKVAKANQELYHQAELKLDRYMKVYNLDDNQNFKNSLFGFVNACTNVRTREQSNPLDVIKPVLPADVVNSPCNFDYLCRAAMLNKVA